GSEVVMKAQLELTCVTGHGAASRGGLLRLQRCVLGRSWQSKLHGPQFEKIILRSTLHRADPQRLGKTPQAKLPARAGNLHVFPKQWRAAQRETRLKKLLCRDTFGHVGLKRTVPCEQILRLDGGIFRAQIPFGHSSRLECRRSLEMRLWQGQSHLFPARFPRAGNPKTLSDSTYT